MLTDLKNILSGLVDPVPTCFICFCDKNRFSYLYGRHCISVNYEIFLNEMIVMLFCNRDKFI